MNRRPSLATETATTDRTRNQVSPKRTGSHSRTPAFRTLARNVAQLRRKQGVVTAALLTFYSCDVAGAVFLILDTCKGVS